MLTRAMILVAILTLAACGDAPPDAPDDTRGPGERGVLVTSARVLAPSTLERTAVYADISNPGTAQDTLLAIEAVIAETGSLHEMSVQDGMMRMTPISRILIPVGSTMSLAPGGLHAMLEGLTHMPAPGDSVEVTLRFANAGPRTVWATVQDPADAR